MGVGRLGGGFEIRPDIKPQSTDAKISGGRISQEVVKGPDLDFNRNAPQVYHLPKRTLFEKVVNGFTAIVHVFSKGLSKMGGMSQTDRALDAKVKSAYDAMNQVFEDKGFPKDVKAELLTTIKEGFDDVPEGKNKDVDLLIKQLDRSIENLK
jgi:hypothetical protein